MDNKSYHRQNGKWNIKTEMLLFPSPCKKKIKTWTELKRKLQNYEEFLLERLPWHNKTTHKGNWRWRWLFRRSIFKNTLTFQCLFEAKTLRSLRIRYHYLEKEIVLKHNYLKGTYFFRKTPAHFYFVWRKTI